MGKSSRAVALAGLALIALSFLPWPAGGALRASTGAAVSTGDPVTQGAALFRAKGCVSCHRHDAVDAEGGQIGPDLTQYVVDPVFLRDWLQDPAAIRPDTQMPNLQLHPAEIEALIAFLQSGPDGSESGRLDPVSGYANDRDGVWAPSSAPMAPSPGAIIDARFEMKTGFPEQPANECPVTLPAAHPFRPPSPYPDTAPYAGKFWFGTESLWTMLPASGRWDQLGRGEKVWWWREGYVGTDEPQPELSVSARRLDGEAPIATTKAPATNGYHRDFRWAMLTGLQVGTPGCWEVTGRYQGEALTFVVWVSP